MRLIKNIFAKSLLLSCLVVVFTIAIFMAAIIPLQKAALVRGLETRSKDLAVSFTENVLFALAAEDDAPVVEYSQKIADQHQAIAYILVVKLDGSSLVFTKGNWEYHPYGGKKFPSGMEQSGGRFLDSPLSGEKVFHHVTPLTYMGIELGSFQTGLSLEEYNHQLRTMYLWTLAIALLALFLGFLVSWRFSGRLSKPIHELQAMTRHISHEDLDQTIDLRTGDELEDLAKSFNDMTRSLRQSRDQLNRAHAVLEDRVRERTRELEDSEQRYRALYAESKRTGELYRTLLDASADAIVVFDTDRVPQYVNPAFSRLFEWDLSGLKGHFARFFPSPVWDKIHHLMDIKPDRGNILSEQIQLRTKNDVLLDASLSGAAFLDESGRVGGCIVQIRDITETRRMEAELVKVQKLESVGILAGGIAHDFNNTLSGILLSAEVAKRHLPSNHPALPYIASIEEATTRSKALTSQLLTFAKGGAPIMVPLHIGELLKEWSEFALRGLKSRCEFDIAQDLWPIRADSGQLSQVIHNLVLNADQAEPADGIVRISARNLDIANLMGPADLAIKPGRYVLITVSDRGKGIPRDYLAKIFDPFFSTKDRGSGLGLSTSYSIIRKHQGYITVESVVGQGTEFRVCLPASDEQPLPQTAVVERSVSGKGRRVLIMDDETMILEVANDALKDAGFVAMGAENGDQALKWFEKSVADGRPFDAVVLDLTIPGGRGGKEIIHSLRALSPRLKAVVSSGYSMDPVMSNYQAHGFDGILVKPYRIDDLLALLDSLLTV